MPDIQYVECMGCFSPCAEYYDALVVRHKDSIVAAVCPTCLEDVKKPQIVLTRATATAPFKPLQYTALEIIR